VVTEKAVRVCQVGLALADRLDLRTRELYPGDELLQKLKQVGGFFVPYLYSFVDHDAQKYGFISNKNCIFINSII
jgi:hypothetical protein